MANNNSLNQLPANNLTSAQILEAQHRVAMKDLEHFLRWLQASDREFLIFFSKDLLDSLRFEPDNLRLVQQLVHCYEQHRLTIAYDTRVEKEPITGEEIEVAVCKDDRLTLAEKDRLVRKLVIDLKDAVPGWSLDGEPIG